MKILALIIILTSSWASAGFRLASYNIRNFDYDERSNIPTNKDHLISQLKEMSPDLMAVQEINEKEVFSQMIKKNFHGIYQTAITDCGGAHEQKLGFVYNTNKFKLISFKEDLRTSNVNHPHRGTCYEGSRPLAVAIFKRMDNGQNIVAISVHLKSGGQPKSIRKRFKQLAIIQDVIREHQKRGHKHFIAMGDFNSTEYIHQNSKPHQDFKRTVSQLNAVDLSTQISCTSYWWGGVDDRTQYPSLLDHIIISKSLTGGKTPQLKSYGHCAKLRCQATAESSMGVSFDEVSDHCPLLSEIN